MAYDVKIVERAAAEIARRRQQAESTARRHRDELLREIPELAAVQERIVSSGMQVPTALGRGEDGIRIIRRLRDEITRRGLKTRIQVDGGVSPKTAHIVAEAGADVLVAGSAVYGAENPAQAIDDIRTKAEAAFKA